MQSACNQRLVVSPDEEGHQQVLALRCHPEAIKRSSRGNQEAIQRPSRGHQEVIQKPSRGHPEAIQRPSKGHQKAINANLAHEI